MKDKIQKPQSMEVFNARQFLQELILMESQWAQHDSLFSQTLEEAANYVSRVAFKHMPSCDRPACFSFESKFGQDVLDAVSESLALILSSDEKSQIEVFANQASFSPFEQRRRALLRQLVYYAQAELEKQLKKSWRRQRIAKSNQQDLTMATLKGSESITNSDGVEISDKLLKAMEEFCAHEKSLILILNAMKEGVLKRNEIVKQTGLDDYLVKEGLRKLRRFATIYINQKLMMDWDEVLSTFNRRGINEGKESGCNTMEVFL